MLFSRIVRKNGERVFGTFQNVDSTAIADGECIVLNTTATPTLPGIEVKRGSGAAVQLTVVGIASGAIAIGDFGLVQVYGLHENVKTSAAALAAGSTLTSSASVAAAVDAGAGTDDPSARLGFSVVVGASNRAKCFIKALG